MSRFPLAFSLILLIASSTYAQSEKTIILFAQGGAPIGAMRQDDYTRGYGGGIRYEWEESKHISLSFSIHMMGWSRKKEFTQLDTSDEIVFDGGSPMEASIPFELGLKFRFVRDPLIPALLLAGGLYFGDGSKTDVVVPGIGAFIAPGIGMQIPLTVSHAIDTRIKAVFGASSAIDVSYISLDLGIAFTL